MELSEHFKVLNCKSFRKVKRCYIDVRVYKCKIVIKQTYCGRRPLTFLDTVARDTGLDVSEVRTVMLDNIELYGVKSSEGYLRNAT